MRLFIADDSPYIRERLISMLNSVTGLEIVGESENIQDTIKSIDALKPDAAILDIRMPGGSGIDVLEHFQNKTYPNLKIIFTNYPYPQYKKRCLNKGAHHFLSKSEDFNKIIEILESVIGKKSLGSSTVFT